VTNTLTCVFGSILCKQAYTVVRVLMTSSSTWVHRESSACWYAYSQSSFKFTGLRLLLLLLLPPDPLLPAAGSRDELASSPTFYRPYSSSSPVGWPLARWPELYYIDTHSKIKLFQFSRRQSIRQRYGEVGRRYQLVVTLHRGWWTLYSQFSCRELLAPVLGWKNNNSRQCSNMNYTWGPRGSSQNPLRQQEHYYCDAGSRCYNTDVTPPLVCYRSYH